jgi:hypothetical protein
MPTHKHERQHKEEDWDFILTTWFIRKGFLQGIVNNLHDALDEQQQRTPFQILEHLNDQWCPLDIKAKKALKDVYYTKWDGNEHLTAFKKHLNDNQRALVRSKVTIADKDKLQFYLEEMYDSNHFDKNEMLDCEQQITAIKTNYSLQNNTLRRW